MNTYTKLYLEHFKKAVTIESLQEPQLPDPSIPPVRPAIPQGVPPQGQLPPITPAPYPKISPPKPNP